MAATIKIKNSSTAGAAPTSSDLVQGELAVNVTDKRLFTENSGGTVVELGTNPSSITLPDGSASAPTLLHSGDTNTGLFFPAADTIALTTGGTERARVDSSGNLGLGVTPSAWGSTWKALQLNNGSVASNGNVFDLPQNAYFGAGGSYIYTTTAAASIYRQNSGAHSWFNAASGTAGNAITFTQAMTLDASGNLGVGTTSPSQKLDVAAPSGTIQLTSTTGTNFTDVRVVNTGGTLYSGIERSTGGVLGPTGAYEAFFLYSGSTNPMGIGTLGNSYLRFITNSTERARIDTSGNLLVGQTTQSGTTVGTSINPTGVIRVANSSSSAGSTFEVYSTGASAYRFYVNFSGQINATSTTISAISDIRFKENIRDLNVGLSEVMALKPRLYDWKEGKGADIKNARGFIAQEFEQVFPDLIDEWKDPAPEGEEPYKSVRADLIPVLVKAIQEQQAIITQLQADVAALKG